jgi:hypothetical protein
LIDETWQTFIKTRKHPRKGEKKKQGAMTKVQASKPHDLILLNQ